jgi:hypothetical protein
VLSRAELRAQFWPSLPWADLNALFYLIEQEFAIPAGILRPEDNLEQLFAPLSIRQPLRWFRTGPVLEDAVSELSYRLSEQVRARGQRVSSRFRARTVDELVRVWCGVPLS